jgi:hypothetical protein
VSLALTHAPTLALPRLRGPGLGWLPAVWRRGATWRTVGRFGFFGPLIGGAPYAVFVLTIPFVYLVGLAPALVAGFLFATWYHSGGGTGWSRAPSWPWRALMGALSGAATAAAFAFYFHVAAGDAWFVAIVIAAHGMPAAIVLALLQRPARAEPARGIGTRQRAG